MDYLAPLLAIALPALLILLLTASQLNPALVAKRGSRDEFPGRRQGGGGHGCNPTEQVEESEDC